MNKLVASRYWILFTCLFSSFSWMKWLSYVGAAIALCGIPIYLIWNSPLGFIIGGILVSSAIFMNLVGLPYQMLSIASSKQVNLLPGIRRDSLIILIFICLFVSISFTIITLASKKSEIIPTFFAMSFLISVVFIAILFVGQKFAGTQGLVYVFLGFLAPFYNILLNINWVILLILGCGMWLVFSRYWLSWRPAKFQPNIFGMPTEQLLAFNKQRWAQISPWLDGALSANPKTLVGSLLLGRADGARAKFVSIFSILLSLSVVAALFIAISGKQRFQEFYTLAGQANLFVLYICVAYGLSVVML